MSFDKLRFDPTRNLIWLGGRRIVFHCHHYNLFLQQTVSDVLQDDAKAVEVAASTEATRGLLTALLSEPSQAAVQSFAERIDLASQLFRALGFGLADTTGLSPEGGNVALVTSHYALGWRLKQGKAAAPICHFATGFWIGALCAVLQVNPERILGTETSCGAQSGETAFDNPCRIDLEVL